MSTAAEQARAEATFEKGEGASRLKVFAIRVLNYLTNHVVAHLPSFGLRRLWYTRVLGASIGPGTGIHLGCYLWFYSPSQVRREGLVIGRNSRVNRDCTLDVRGGLRIGDNVSISPEVMILTAQHPLDDPEFRVATRPIVLEDHVFVGSRAIVMPGVTLGRGSVVAAGAIVTRDVPPFAIVAGMPARVVGRRPEEAATYVLDSPFPLFE